MASLPPRSPLAIALAAGAALACAHAAPAATLTWLSAAGGSAATPANWSPAQLPVAGDDLLFNLPGAFTVTWPATVATSRTQTYRQGTVTASVTSPHTATLGITIGDTSGLTGTLSLTSGALTSSASVNLGQIAGSIGILNVSGDSSDFLVTGATSDLTVGVNGNAALNISGGGLVRVADQFVLGSNATSAPTLTVSGAQAVPPFQRSRLVVLGASQSRLGQGGDATVNISNGALADFAGDLVVANGSASVTTITLAGNGGIGGLNSATLDVAGNLLLGRNTSAGVLAGAATVNINSGGSLVVGGELQVGGDPDGGSGTINLSGGAINAPATIGPGGLIAGAGSLGGSVLMSGGTLAPSGTGMTFTGTLNNTLPVGINGTHIHFAPTGSYVGSGTCTAEISGDSSALIQATGNLVIGRNVTSGFSYVGRIQAGSSDITLVDSNGAVLGGQTDLGSGRILCASGIGNQNGGRVFGRGTLVGNVVNSGVIDPEAALEADGAIMNIQGNLICNPSGVLDFEIGGAPGDSSNDRLNVSGAATFGGTVRVRFRPGFELRIGEQFILCNATGGRTGEFAIDDIPVPCPPLQRPVIVYSSSAAILVIGANGRCQRPDFNCDGNLDPDDLSDYITCFFTAPPCPGVDFNGDGNIDPDDLSDYITVFFSC